MSLAESHSQASCLSNASIVIVDAQNEYRTGLLALDGVEEALVQIANLLRSARAVNTPIIHIRHAGSAGGAFDLSQARGQIADVVEPLTGERVIDKTLPNAFAKTDLHAHLSELGRRQLIVVGFMTHMCVSSTVRAGLDLGYVSTVIASATATRALPGATSEEPVSSTVLQRATLAAMSDRFATIVGDVSEIPA